MARLRSRGSLAQAVARPTPCVPYMHAACQLWIAPARRARAIIAQIRIHVLKTEPSRGPDGPEHGAWGVNALAFKARPGYARYPSLSVYAIAPTQVM